MAGSSRGGPLLVVLVIVCNALLAAGSLHPLSDADKEAAKKLFVAREDDTFGSLEETYQAVRALQALRSADYNAADISNLVSELTSSSPDVKDIFYGLRTIQLLHGKEGPVVGAKHHWSEDSHHAFAPAVGGVLARIKALGEGHGTWRYAEDEVDSSAKAADWPLIPLRESLRLQMWRALSRRSYFPLFLKDLADPPL